MDWFTNPKRSEAVKLIAQLGDATKRDRATQDLMRFGADAVPALVDALQTQDLNLLAIYQQILARIPSASPELARALQSAHPLIRGRVAETLAIRKDPATLPALREALHGEFFTVRARAMLALAALNDKEAIPGILPLLKDREDEVRIAACKALGKFQDPTTFDELADVMLDDPQINVRQAAVKALGAGRNPAAIPFLMEALRDSFWWYEREQAAKDLLTVIANMGEAVVEPLLEALTDREKTVRKFAVMVLGYLHDMRALDELGMALYDLHHEVSQAAAEALAQFGESAVALLQEALMHPEAAVREHAILGLSKIQSASVIPLLIEMLHDPDRTVKRCAVEALAGIDRQDVQMALQAVAADRSDRELALLAKQALER